jgi:hypothetical protein
MFLATEFDNIREKIVNCIIEQTFSYNVDFRIFLYFSVSFESIFRLASALGQVQNAFLFYFIFKFYFHPLKTE